MDSLGLFSSNDEVEDISTADLKYLLIDYYAGDLGSRTCAREPRDRLRDLLEASFFLKTFLTKCDRMMIAGTYMYIYAHVYVSESSSVES